MRKPLVMLIMVVILSNLSFLSNIQHNSEELSSEAFQTSFSVMANINVVHDGEVKTGEYAVLVTLDTNFELHYTINESTIYMGLKTKAKGWVAIGIDPVSGSDMSYADIFIGSTSNIIRDDYANTSATHYPDTDFGGTNDTLSFAVGTAQGGTHLEFSRKLNTQDAYDKIITVGANSSLFWAYSGSDDFTTPASVKGFSSTIFQDVPTAPRNLVATPDNASITLNWTSPVNDGGLIITEYNVYRSSTGGSNYNLIGTNTSATGYFDTNVANGNRYFYVVTVVNSLGVSLYSNEVTIIPGTPSPPLNLSLMEENNQVILNWNTPKTDSGYAITKYSVYRSSTSGGPYSVLSNTTQLSYVDTTVIKGNTYYYVVTAINSIGESEISNEMSITFLGTPTDTTSTPSDTAPTSTTTTTSKRGSFPSLLTMILFLSILIIFVRKKRRT